MRSGENNSYRDTNIHDLEGVTIPEKKSFMKRAWNVKTLCLAIDTALLGILLYTFSPEIGSPHHTTKKLKVKKENAMYYPWIDSVYETEDAETNIILDLMSGHGDVKKVSRLLREYSYYKAFPMELFAKPDKALYETIRELNKKYWTPYITFDKRYNFLGYGKESPAMYTPDHKEHINNFDSVVVKMEKAPTPPPVRKTSLPTSSNNSSRELLLLFLISQNQNESKQQEREKESGKKVIYVDERQKYLINRWLAELAHAYQMQRDWAIALSMKVGRDVSTNTLLGNSYDDLYNKRGSFEQKAHKSITPFIIETEFIPRYISKSDTNNLDVRKKIAELHNGFFDRFQDPEAAKRRLGK